MAIKDLKLKILEETYRIISEEGLENFSVRNLSNRLNISHNAMYRHFKSKTELLFSLVSIGFEHMTTQFAAIRERNDIDVVEQFKECAYLYFEFAVNNPHVYKIMYSFDMVHEEFPDYLIEAYRKNFTQILGLAEDCLKTGRAPKGSAYSIANTVWAFGHGLSSLITDNILARKKDLDSLPVLLQDEEVKSPDNIREVIAFSINIFFDSLFTEKKGQTRKKN